MTDALAVAATELIEPFEGFSPTPYRDPGGVWSIGFGSTIDAWGATVSADTPPISRDDALALVERDLTTAQSQLAALVFVPLDTNQQAALIDFIYNVGAGNFARSTLRALLNQGDYQGAAAQFVRWDYAAGQVMPGLLRRREAEAQLFQTSDALSLAVSAAMATLDAP